MVRLLTDPVWLQRLEGLTLFFGSLWAWEALGGNWGVFVLFFLAPDLSALGYLSGPRVGAAVYNLIHSYPVPALLLAYGLSSGASLATLTGILILAHIGLDRLLGYGLKLPSGFQDTHLGRIGRGRVGG